jgi:hypothetical protein
MNEITEFERFHPRAVKLLRKRKPFIVVACDEPYFMGTYSLIRSHEMAKGSWSEVDERIYRDAQLRIGADEAGQDLTCTCDKVKFYPWENVTDEACPIHGVKS